MAESFEDERLKHFTGVRCEECQRHTAKGTGKAVHNTLMMRWFVEYLCARCGERFYTWRLEADPVVRDIVAERYPAPEPEPD